MRVAAGILAAVVLCLAPGRPARAYCHHAQECYCELTERSSHFLSSLVRARVVSVGESVTLEMLREPYCAPGGWLSAGQQVGGFSYYAPQWLPLDPQNAGLFKLNPYTMEIEDYMPEGEDGLIACPDDPEFPGATADQIAHAVLSGDCYAEVGRLGVQVECWNDLINEGCASASPGPASPLFWLLILALLLKKCIQRQV